jgi:hypothetical protein
MVGCKGTPCTHPTLEHSFSSCYGREVVLLCKHLQNHLSVSEDHLECTVTLLLPSLQVKELENSIVTNFRGLAKTNFKPTPVHLLSLTTTLAQACGSTRLVIKSQTFTINAVRPTWCWLFLYE